MKSKTCVLTVFLVALIFNALLAQEFEVYISDAGGFNLPPWQILKFDANGENGEVFISDHLGWPQDILFLENQNVVLISNLNDDVISKFNATTGAFIGEFATNVDGPTRMEIGPDGLLYVLQWAPATKVMRYNLDGTFVGEFTSTNTGTAIGMDWDSEGNFYVSSFNGKYVRKYSPTGEEVGDFINSNLSGPTNIWFDNNGDLLVCDWNDAQVKRFDSEGNFLGVFINGVPQCEGVDFLPNGDIVIGVGAQGAVRIYNPDGTLVGDLFPPGSLDLLTPNAVVIREKTVNPVFEIYAEIDFVKPSVGVQFQVSNPDEFQPKSFFEVYSSTGEFISKTNFTESSVWDASNVVNGVYYITVKMTDGKIARQKVIVQK